jgi:hypothetical protein
MRRGIENPGNIRKSMFARVYTIVEKQIYKYVKGTVKELIIRNFL